MVVILAVILLVGVTDGRLVLLYKVRGRLASKRSLAANVSRVMVFILFYLLTFLSDGSDRLQIALHLDLVVRDVLVLLSLRCLVSHIRAVPAVMILVRGMHHVVVSRVAAHVAKGFFLAIVGNFTGLIHAESCSVLVGQLELCLVAIDIASCGNTARAIVPHVRSDMLSLVNLGRAHLDIAEASGVKEQTRVLLLLIHETKGRVARLAALGVRRSGTRIAHSYFSLVHGDVLCCHSCRDSSLIDSLVLSCDSNGSGHRACSNVLLA